MRNLPPNPSPNANLKPIRPKSPPALTLVVQIKHRAPHRTHNGSQSRQGRQTRPRYLALHDRNMSYADKAYRIMKQAGRPAEAQRAYAAIMVLPVQRRKEAYEKLRTDQELLTVAKLYTTVAKLNNLTAYADKAYHTIYRLGGGRVAAQRVFDAIMAVPVQKRKDKFEELTEDPIFRSCALVDLGPFACRGGDCPAESVSCLLLNESNYCTRRFSDAFYQRPATHGISNLTRVRDVCAGLLCITVYRGSNDDCGISNVSDPSDPCLCQYYIKE